MADNVDFLETYGRFTSTTTAPCVEWKWTMLLGKAISKRIDRVRSMPFPSRLIQNKRERMGCKEQLHEAAMTNLHTCLTSGEGETQGQAQMPHAL
jgi:hypothetical protein